MDSKILTNECEEEKQQVIKIDIFDPYIIGIMCKMLEMKEIYKFKLINKKLFTIKKQIV